MSARHTTKLLAYSMPYWSLNEVFARHLLATTKQQPGQSLDDYLQELRRLSKDCNFQAVTKAEHRDGFIRDAFINGILSHSIRHRLLEERTLMIDSAFDKARALDVAQRNSESYVSSGISASTAASPQPAACVVSQGDSTFAVHKNKACFFCGSEKRHDRKMPCAFGSVL